MAPPSNLDLLEVFSYILVFSVWLVVKRVFHRNITGDILVGSFMGFFLEFTTTPVCDYHFRITIYKDLPLIIPFAWGMMFALTVWLSEKMYTKLKNLPAIQPGDKSIFLFDMTAGVLIGFPLETIGSWLGAWNYNVERIGWTLGTIPFVKMPLEALIGYCLIMLIGPTFVRYWQASFEGRA